MRDRTARERAHRLLAHLPSALLALVFILAPGVVWGQKTDVVTFRNGDQVTGEIAELDEGKLTFKTDGMKTVRALWPRVVTVKTDKTFEIVLVDGTIYFGSMQPGVADSVVIQTDSKSLQVPTQSVVRLQRLKPSFWAALEGDIGIGFDFTQQSRKTDLNLDFEVTYARRSYLTKIDFNSTYSRQDDADEIYRLSGMLKHARQYKKRWLYLGFFNGSRNSQLSLDSRISVGGGFGRLLVESNKMGLAAWIAPAYSREQYVGDPGANAFPLIVAGEFLLFIWDPLDTEISTRLGVLPMLNDLKRWRIDFNLTAKRELVSDLFLGIGVTNLYDSRPPAADANKNDFSFTTLLGWSY